MSGLHLNKMRNRFDQFAKQLLRAALAPAGPVETDAEVDHETQRIDVSFVPDPTRAGELDALGLLGRLAAEPSSFEPFHRTPDTGELLACLRKHLAFRHALTLRPREPGAPAPDEPMLSVLSAGRPAGSMAPFGMRRVRGFPRGVYAAPEALRMRIVVISELPATRETRLLRLMGAGRVLKQAVRELKALPDDAPERALALPTLLRLRIEVPADPAQRTEDDEEFLMSTQDIVETLRQRWRQEGFHDGIEQGIERGIEQGIERGIEQGIERGWARAIVAAYEARFGPIPKKLRAALQKIHDEATLSRLHQMVVTDSAKEIAAALKKRGG